MAIDLPLGEPNRTWHHLKGGLVGGSIGLAAIAPHHGLTVCFSGLLFLGYMASLTRTTRRAATEISVAVGALGRGELVEARAVFTRWATSPLAQISGIARHNLGWTLMQEGELDDAAAILTDAAANHPRYLIATGMLPITLVDAALCYGLVGDVALAETWFEKSLLPVKGPTQPAFPAMAAIVRGVLDCRQGRPEQAAVALQHALEGHEAVMSGGMLRLLRVLRAFSCATADGPRSQGVVEQMLGDMRPRYEREFEFLGTRWPAMAAFLAAHRLARPSVTGASEGAAEALAASAPST